jgi:hypothetical protein
MERAQSAPQRVNHPYLRRHVNPILHAAQQDARFARPERPDHEDGWHVDYETRFQSLSDNGLPARAEVVLSNDWLWMIRLHPKSDPADWAPRFGGARLREGLTDYQKSIVEKGLAEALMPDIAERWHDRDITVRFMQGRGSGGSMNLEGGIADDPAVIEAHRRSKAYGHKPLHVSM